MNASSRVLSFLCGTMLAGFTTSHCESQPHPSPELIATTAERSAPRETTYAKDVSRILIHKCTKCHHADTAAPFSLTSFEETRDWAETIKEAVLDRRMPPWNADPRYGVFSNDLRLSDQELKTIVDWVDNGMAYGNKRDLPEMPEYVDGWTIGKPDVIFEMPREFEVKATGTVPYKYFTTPTNFKEDVWVQAAEARPGNRSVVHHIIVFYRDPEKPKQRILPAIVGTAPGEEPVEFPVGTGIKVPAGSELVWQMHYTPTGKIETDRSQVGLIFSKSPPKRRVKAGMAFNFLFRIPPNSDNHEVVATTRFRNDVELLSLMPHMHLRGKDFVYRAHYPDGTTKTLLNVPKYDFNWQHRYRYKTPLHIPAGTKIECVAHFDNSEKNPANPDPSKPVRWGDQTWEEMMIGFVDYVDALETKKPSEDSADSDASE